MLIRLHRNVYLNLSLLPLKVISKNIPSPYNIAPHIHQGRTVNQGYDHKLNKLNNLSLKAPYEMYREQDEECAYWC